MTLPEPTSVAGDAGLRQTPARALVLVLWIIMLLFALVLVFGWLQNESRSQIMGYTAMLLALGLMLRLLKQGHFRVVTSMLVFSLLANTVYAVAAAGSIRSVSAIGFVGSVVIAGIVLPRRDLIICLLLCSGAIAGLIWAENASLLAAPSPHVGLRDWVTHVMALIAVATGVYTSQGLMVQALRDKRAELLRRETAEAALRLSEDRASRVFRHSPAAMFVQAQDDLKILDVNHAFERMFGYSQTEIIGCEDVRLWKNEAERTEVLRQLGLFKRVANFSAIGKRKDGSLLSVLFSCELHDGEQSGLLVSSIIDISAEVDARRAARQSQELFVKAFDLSPIHMSIVRAADGVFIAVNGAESLQGYTPDELIGQPCVSMGTWPGDAERERFMARLRAYPEGVMSEKTQMRHKAGHLVDCNLWAVIASISGEECVLSSVINTTEQRRRETQLLDLASGLSGETGKPFFSSVAQHMARSLGADLVVVGELMADQTIQSLAVVRNGQRVEDMRYALAGTPSSAVLQSRDLCVFPDHVDTLFPQAMVLGQDQFKACTGFAMRDVDGNPIGVLTALWRQPQPASADRDALLRIFASRANAELVRLQIDREVQRLNETLEQRVDQRTNQLRATNAELESFGYSVSHDLQSPLRSIQGFMFLLERRLQGRLNTEEERLLERVRVNVLRMHELIKDLLTLARASQGKLARRQTDLSAMAREVVLQQRQRDPQRHAAITIEPGILVMCDEKLARIVLENLIGNAWKYSRDRIDSHIEFGRKPAAGCGNETLFVRDNGAGFNMEYVASLFKPFHRLHHANEFEGSGIGLATVHRILERHGGAICAEATEGAGACFWFSFGSVESWPSSRPGELLASEPA